ncbi:MAG: hypothetical protein ACT4PM_01960 [Gemmatimonadales bacterium]
MREPATRRQGGAWLALREELLYSPLAWLAVLFAVAPLLQEYQLPGARAAGFLLQRWYVFIGLIVIWRPFLAPTVGLLLYTFLFIGRRVETPEQLRRRLLTRMRAGQDIQAESQALARIAEEGNADPEHLDASLSLWTAARYLRHPALEAEASRQVMELLTVDARRWEGRWLLPNYRAWLIRADAMLRPNPRAHACVPPPLPIGPGPAQGG